VSATSYEFPVERSKIREFAKATKSRHAAYDGPDAVIPPTFLTHARLSWEPLELSPAAELGFDLGRILHGEEEYVFHGPPPRAGQTLHVTTRMGERWEKAGRRGGTMRFAQMVNEFHDDAGVLVATQITTVLETGKV
jgi:hypothetical protein